MSIDSHIIQRSMKSWMKDKTRHFLGLLNAARDYSCPHPTQPHSPIYHRIHEVVQIFNKFFKDLQAHLCGIWTDLLNENDTNEMKTHTTDIAPWMSYNAIRTRRHTLDLPTLRTDGRFRIARTEVAKCSVLLSPLAWVTCHVLVTWMLPQIHHILLVGNLLLPYAHTFGLLPSSRLPFRHLA